MVTSADSITLTQRDEQILKEHFARFRITTIEALQRVYWPDRTPDAAKKWSQRMRAAEFLRHGDLGNGRHFYYPAHKTVALAGLARRSTRPPKGYDLARLYGVLSFCCLGEPLREKISAAEFQQRFGHLWARNIDQTLYYADREFQNERFPRQNRIGYLLIDAGGRVRQILTRFQRVISQRLKIPLWHQWIERDRFLITVVTADADKQRQLHRSLAAIRQPVAFRVEVRPDLCDVIPLRLAHAS